MALSAIAPLHQATARLIVVDNVCVLRQCVVEPVADLNHICPRLDPRLVPKLDGLETMLARALVGLRMPVSWTHGDYTPGQRSGGRDAGPGKRHRRLGRGAGGQAGADRRVPHGSDGELSGGAS